MKDEEKVVFAITDDKKTVILGFSEKAWDFMKDGMTHTLDLNSLGIGLRVIMFGGKTRADVLKPLQITPDTLDVSGIDFGFGGE